MALPLAKAHKVRKSEQTGVFFALQDFLFTFALDYNINSVLCTPVCGYGGMQTDAVGELEMLQRSFTSNQKARCGRKLSGY